MSDPLLQNIAKNISDNLPASWQDFKLEKFSKEKTLYDFQQDALKNALKILWRYYDEKIDYQEKENLERNQERKKYLYDFYKADSNFPEKRPDYDLTKKEEKKTAKLLEEYYPVIDNKVSFENFINRMNFWMATGSGKTLVIVKLIEILSKLIKRKEIPDNDILFLTYRDDLIEQFKEYIKEINSSQNDFYINLKSLKEWDEAKRDQANLFKEKGITIFYYRSDNLWTEQKEKRLDFRNYDNFGRWYILLDEAHKGEKEDSIRQMIYSIMSRNGFLFNFSATFVDPRDFLTTVFNYNLSVFIENGYGKRIYLSQEEIKAFKDKTDFTENEKQKIVLKTLILLSYLKKISLKIKKVDKKLYHYPLLLTLVNSVNIEDADLKLFFKEIEKIGNGKIKEEILKSAKKELLETLSLNPKIIFPQREEIKIDKNLLEKISYQDILEDVYNSKSSGTIEILTIPGNRQEMVFRLKKSERPFALIKIGDISKWIKETFEGYEIIESFDNESVFKKINRDDSDINILMGSRTFYEGWDSNRPNIILYINIGTGTQAKKFVLQSVGRGVRIEPIKNERKRLGFLYQEKRITIFEKIKDLAFQIETLFVFGTNPSALEETIATFREISKEEGVIIKDYFEINKKAEKLPLFIPVYKDADHILAEEKEPPKYILSEEDFNLTKKYFEYLADDRILLMLYETTPEVLSFIKNSFNSHRDYYQFEDKEYIGKPQLLLSQIINHFSLIPEKFKNFEKLEKGKFIIHFESIKFNLEIKNLNEFLEKINEVKSIEKKEKKIRELQLKLFEEGIKEQDLFSRPFDGIKIKYVPNHYYYPIILSEPKHKIDYLNHIITEESEINFIKDLDRYIAEENNLFNKKFDWWLFSKLDEATDEIYIPWNNPKTNKIDHFKPDFIFWMKEKGNKNYHIVFIDPKGTEHIEAYRKIDGFRSIFENKKFFHNGFNIKVRLFCKPKDQAYAIEEYKKYWFDNLHKILEIL
jgi:superfamily II DNA or RNA helicase